MNITFLQFAKDALHDSNSHLNSLSLYHLYTGEVANLTCIQHHPDPLLDTPHIETGASAIRSIDRTFVPSQQAKYSPNGFFKDLGPGPLGIESNQPYPAWMNHSVCPTSVASAEFPILHAVLKHWESIFGKMVIRLPKSAWSASGRKRYYTTGVPML